MMYMEVVMDDNALQILVTQATKDIQEMSVNKVLSLAIRARVLEIQAINRRKG